ncbi:glutathione S-transferase [Methylobacillus sp. MM3]|jgi:glutathione S-transferase|uniref:glutathione S-transferase n=1 Tax=Methylobacillus sp. MM3 TaxID=1848039 RepID=UPI0007DF82B6|nr:glutathione S-transferase [Methylobacillus sp. MM3]
MMQHPILYSFRRCPYAMRARMALLASGTICELREIILRAKPQELFAASPKGTVPVLVLPDGTVIEESLDIMLWALECNDPQHWLAPEHGSLDDMLHLIAQCDGDFKLHLDRYKYPNRYNNVDPLEHRAAGADYLLALESRLAHRPYLFGSRPALADIATFPFIRQFAQTDQAWFDAQPWPQLLRWLSTLLDSALFSSVMHKFDPWEPASTGPVFPAQ